MGRVRQRLQRRSAVDHARYAPRSMGSGLRPLRSPQGDRQPDNRPDLAFDLFRGGAPSSRRISLAVSSACPRTISTRPAGTSRRASATGLRAAVGRERSLFRGFGRDFRADRGRQHDKVQARAREGSDSAPDSRIRCSIIARTETQRTSLAPGGSVDPRSVASATSSAKRSQCFGAPLHRLGAAGIGLYHHEPREGGPGRQEAQEVAEGVADGCRPIRVAFEGSNVAAAIWAPPLSSAKRRASSLSAKFP